MAMARCFGMWPTVASARARSHRGGSPKFRLATPASWSTLGSPSRERMPSLSYTWPRCVSTVLRLTNRAWAISGFERPCTASFATRRSLAVKRVLATEHVPPGPGARGEELGAGPFGQHARAAAGRQFERFLQRRPPIRPTVRPPEGGPEIGQRPRVLQTRRRALQQLGGAPEAGDGLPRPQERGGRPGASRHRSRRASPTPRRSQLLLGEGAGRLDVPVRPLRQGEVDAPRDEDWVPQAEGVVAPAALHEVRDAVVAPAGGEAEATAGAKEDVERSRQGNVAVSHAQRAASASWPASSSPRSSADADAPGRRSPRRREEPGAAG